MSKTNEKICSVLHCERRIRCKGLCDNHYNRMLLKKQTCSVEGCTNSNFALKLCRSHYHSLKVYGDVLRRTVRTENEFIHKGSFYEIVLFDRSGNPKIRKAFIDSEDYEKVKKHKWHSENKYITTKIEGLSVSLHHFVLGITRIGKSVYIDHKNKDGYDCRKENLRKCTASQNQLNRKIGITNSSGYTGVRLYRGKWIATAILNGKSFHLGTFLTKKEAVEKRKQFEEEKFGDFLPKHHFNKERRLQCPST